MPFCPGGGCSQQLKGREPRRGKKGKGGGGRKVREEGEER